MKSRKCHRETESTGFSGQVPRVRWDILAASLKKNTSTCKLILAGLSLLLVLTRLPTAVAQGTYTLYLPLLIGGGRQEAAPFTWPEKRFGIVAEPAANTTQSGIEQIAGSGAGWVRLDALEWAEVEPTPGTRDWTALAEFESRLEEALAFGLTPIVPVAAVPEWAGEDACGPVHPEQLPAFAGFMVDLAHRYADVPVWELFPTPDTADCWGDPSDPFFGGGAYALMLQSVYPAVKEANPQAHILSGSLLLDCDPLHGPAGRDCSSAHFLEGILQAGGGAYLDGVAFQAADGFTIFDFPWGSAYQYGDFNWGSDWLKSGPALSAKVNFIRGVLDAYAAGGKRLVNTRSAILCYSCADFPPFDTAKEGYIPQVYAAAVFMGLDANLWSSIFGEQNSGLVNPVNLAAEPAYQVYAFAAGMLEGAEPLDEIQLEGFRGYRFSRGGATLWVLWHVSAQAESGRVSLDPAPTGVWDMYGAPLPVGPAVDIGLEPVYIEWAGE